VPGHEQDVVQSEARESKQKLGYTQTVMAMRSIRQTAQRGAGSQVSTSHHWHRLLSRSPVRLLRPNVSQVYQFSCPDSRFTQKGCPAMVTLYHAAVTTLYLVSACCTHLLCPDIAHAVADHLVYRTQGVVGSYRSVDTSRLPFVTSQLRFAAFLMLFAARGAMTKLGVPQSMLIRA
jgi:hypothetical protein